MEKLHDWISNHQLIVFFCITFAITWGLGFSYGAVMRGRNFVLAPLVFLATCGPALAGIIVRAFTGSSATSGERSRAWFSFLAAMIVATIVFLGHFALINGVALSPNIVGLSIVMVLPVAFIVNVWYTKRPVIGRLRFDVKASQTSYFWVAVALILLPGLVLASVLVDQFLGGASNAFTSLPATGIALIGWIALKFLYQFFFFNGTGEEAGWRGFALPRLQRRVSPLIASLVLSLIWVPWHVFLWSAEGKPIDTWSYWLLMYSIHLPSGIVICWVYNRSRGSLIVAGIAHAAANTAFAVIGNVDTTPLAVVLWCFTVVIILVDRMWRGLPPDHPAVYRLFKPADEGAQPAEAIAESLA